MIKRLMQIVAIVALVPMAYSVVAQPERYVSGTHYVELRTPVKTNDPAKVEVMEAFWYGCTHCFRFEPLLNSWQANQPDDVDFVLFPAMWNAIMKIHAQVYYAAVALDSVELLHEPIFNAINLEGNRLQNERQIGALSAEHGISQADFEAAFNSFSVRTRVNQAEGRMQDYEIRSTPNMVVNGKYLITTGEAVRTQAEMLEVVDFLVEKERSLLRSPGE